MPVETDDHFESLPQRLETAPSVAAADPFGQTANSRLLFRDEGLGVLTWARSDARAKFNAQIYKSNRAFDASYSTSFDPDSGTADPYSRHGIASGRVMSDDYDQCLVLKRIVVVKADGVRARVTWEVSNPGNAAKAADEAVNTFTFQDYVDFRDDEMHMQTPGALAVADLDGMVIDGRTRDEVITVRETTGRDLTLEVFNFAWGQPPSATGAAIRLPDPLAFLPRLGEPQRRPGAVIVKTGDFSGNGKRQILVVYQPTHQNGNALSYPVLAPGAKYTPADLGSFRRPDAGTPGQTVTLAEPLTTPMLYFWNGNSASQAISWNDTSVGTSSFEYSKTLSGSSDTTLSFESTADYLVMSTRLSGSFKTSTGGSHGWTNQRLDNATSSRTQSLTLNKPAGNPLLGYSFQPVFYVTQDGTLKMASATGFTQGVGEDWWKKTYAGPDAALNLPYRFLPDGSGFNTLDNARRIRGGQAYYATPSPTTGLLTPVSGAVRPGEKLILEVRVHNFSLSSKLGLDANGASKPVKVRFDYVEVDVTSRQETGTRNTIGIAEVEFADANLANPSSAPPSADGKYVIPPRGIGRARLAFDTAVLPKDPAKREYRIYAVVDPDDEIRWRQADGTPPTTPSASASASATTVRRRTRRDGSRWSLCRRRWRRKSRRSPPC